MVGKRRDSIQMIEICPGSILLYSVKAHGWKFSIL